MKTKKIFNSILAGVQGLLVIMMFVGSTGCSGSGGSSGSPQQSFSSNNYTASLGTDFKNVKMESGKQTEIKFTYTLPASITSYKSFSVNLADTMQYVTVSSSPVVKKFNIFEKSKMFAGITKAFAATTTQVTVHISYPEDPDVCSSPIMVGPYEFMGDIGSQPSSATSSTSTSNSGVTDIINAGIFDICVVISPLPIDAYLSVTDVSVDLEPCDETPVAESDFLGTWTGYYDCTNFGTSDAVDLPIALTITKNPDGSYHYEGSIGVFDGHLCGNKFKFNGGEAGSYTESGTFTVNGDGTATKTARWNSIPLGTSGGECFDELTGPT